jgi:hypothetical protein
MYMNDKKQLIVIILTVTLISTLPIVTIDDVLLHMLQQKPVFAQTSSSVSSPSVHITKDTTNSYTISSGSSSIGTFDTTYTILGDINSIKTASNLIMSTITKDYDSSPTIGYVKVSAQTTAEGETSSSSSSQPSTLVNPFADKATINQKINTEIQKAIESAMKSNSANVEIKCDFGMDLSNWKCSSHGLLG